MAYSSPEDLRDAVECNGGVLSLSMDKVRDAFGSGRLGSTIRAEISAKLKRLGLAHMPRELPNYQEQWIRLYLRKSRVGRLIAASRHIGTEADRRLREAANNEANQKLDAIRELLKPRITRAGAAAE